MCCRPLLLSVTLWLSVSPISASSSSPPRDGQSRTAGSDVAGASASFFGHRRSPPERDIKYREKAKAFPQCPYTETWQNLSPCTKTCGDSSYSAVFIKKVSAETSRKLRESKTVSDESPGQRLLATSLEDPQADCVLLLRIQTCPENPPCPTVAEPEAESVGRLRRNARRRERKRERGLGSRYRNHQDQDQEQDPKVAQGAENTTPNAAAPTDAAPSVAPAAAPEETPAAAEETPAAAAAEETPAAGAEEESPPPAAEETPPPPAAEETPPPAAAVETQPPATHRTTKKPVVLSGDDELYRSMFPTSSGAWHITQIIYIISGILLFIVFLIAGGIVLVVVRRRKRRRLEGSAMSRSRAGGTSRQTGYSTSRQTATPSRRTATVAASQQTGAVSKQTGAVSKQTAAAAASTVKAAQSNVPKS